MSKKKLLSTINAVKGYKMPSPQKRSVITALALGEPGESQHLADLLGIPIRTLHVLWSSLRSEGWVEWDGSQYVVTSGVKETVDAWLSLSDLS